MTEPAKPWKRTVTKARKLRQDSTFPESLLWSHLRSGKLAGTKFRRQHPLPPYVLDFYCHAANLAIELDGLSHVSSGAKDDRRTREIEAKGIRVIRFSNDDVLEHLEAVLLTIAKEVGLNW